MLVIGLTIMLLLLSVAVMAAVSRPHLVLYALAAVVSLVGINIHLGITLYLSRVVVIVFLFSTLVRAALVDSLHFPSKFLSTFIALFGLILSSQLVSVLFSPRISDGLRQIFIYASAMAIFLVVIIVSNRIQVVVKAIKIYLATGLVQGLYGIYQLIGSPLGWPTYQTFMAGIPRANDQTTRGESAGYVYSGPLQLFRSGGFFPADVSHYAGYMGGVLILAIALIVYNRRGYFPYFVLLFGGLGLIFSLSRSGIIAFIVFGLPTLLFLLSRVEPATKSLFRSLTMLCLLGLILVGVIGPQVLASLNIKLPNAMGVIFTRLDDISNPGTRSDGTMGEHIETKLAGLAALASSPLIGVGLGVNAAPWQSTSYYRRGWAGSHSHHLDVLGQTGFLGAGLQFLFMALVGMYMWRGLFSTRDQSQARHLLAGLLAAYITIILGNFLYHYFMLDIVWFLMGCGVALSRLLILKAAEEVNQNPRNLSGAYSTI